MLFRLWKDNRSDVFRRFGTDMSLSGRQGHGGPFLEFARLQLHSISISSNSKFTQPFFVSSPSADVSLSDHGFGSQLVTTSALSPKITKLNTHRVTSNLSQAQTASFSRDHPPNRHTIPPLPQPRLVTYVGMMYSIGQLRVGLGEARVWASGDVMVSDRDGRLQDMHSARMRMEGDWPAMGEYGGRASIDADLLFDCVRVPALWPANAVFTRLGINLRGLQWPGIRAH